MDNALDESRNLLIHHREIQAIPDLSMICALDELGKIAKLHHVFVAPVWRVHLEQCISCSSICGCQVGLLDCETADAV